MRAHSTHDIHQIVQRVAFDIEFALWPLLHQRGNVIHIAAADMALVRPWVDGDALRPCPQCHVARVQYAGQAIGAAIAQERDFVDIDRQGGFHRAGVFKR